jgi:CubicO group peptidase (beta-lactamase class C family)
MKRTQLRQFMLVLLGGLLLGSSSQAQQGKAKSQTTRARVQSEATVKPASVGFSSERIERLHASLQEFVDKKQLPGIVTIMSRHGKLVDFKEYGKKDLASGAAMEKDTIFRIYSMTKPVTGVAMMVLYEENKWRLDDPISKYIPEFAKLKVFKGMDGNGNMVLEDPEHAPTMRELMSHTAGFTYGFIGNTPVDKVYQQKGVLQSNSLQDMIDKLAAIPLLYQPGSRWVYSVSVDIQGYIVEKLSGKTLPDFMRERIFEPLGMKDTGFYVPQDKLNRLAAAYNFDLAKQELVPATRIQDFSKPPAMPSGGGGLVSTAADYMRFAQMVLNRGELDGVRILAPRTVELMGANQIPDAARKPEFGVSFFRLRPGEGFGLDFAVQTDSLKAGSLSGDGSITWGGAAGTWFWIDPTYDIVFIGLIQRFTAAGSPDMDYITRTLTYQALVNPEAGRSAVIAADGTGHHAAGRQH